MEDGLELLLFLPLPKCWVTSVHTMLSFMERWGQMRSCAHCTLPSEPHSRPLKIIRDAFRKFNELKKPQRMKKNLISVL